MIRNSILVLCLVAGLAGPLNAQAGDDGRSFLLWIGGTAGFGTAGAIGGVGPNLARGHWLVAARYARSLSGSARDGQEVYVEEFGALVGLLLGEERWRGSVLLGLGPVNEWHENYEPCDPGLFEAPWCGSDTDTRLGGESDDGVGLLFEANYYLNPDGGWFAPGVQLFGAVSPTRSHASLGLTLGVGRTP